MKVCPICKEPSVCDHAGWEYDPENKLAELRRELTEIATTEADGEEEGDAN